MFKIGNKDNTIVQLEQFMCITQQVAYVYCLFLAAGSLHGHVSGLDLSQNSTVSTMRSRRRTVTNNGCEPVHEVMIVGESYLLGSIDIILEQIK